MTDAQPYRHRFSMTIIQHAIWLYHRFPLSDRDVQELLHQRGIGVSQETLREWCIKFGPLFTAELRHREPRRGSRWFLDEVCTTVDGVRHWLWRAVDEHGFVQGILLQRRRDTDAAKTFLTRLLGEYDVPEVIHTDQLQSYGAAIREIPSLTDALHHQVISKAQCNNIVEQEHRPTRRQERSQQGFRRRKRAQAFLSLHARMTNLHHHSRTSVCAAVRRNNQKQAFQTWFVIAAGVA
ncbi:IS6 family transposase [Deinococcus oregonensis]|uniref:IS6 family transposase n=1 Tax=Deinococcus oregonensis TaxID=1805970 RepID=A0ABV6AW91_9DEIO